MRILAMLLFAAASTASAVVIRHGIDDADYRVPAAEFPALADMPGEGHGVLIAPQWIVTAAHTIPPGSLAAITLGGLERKVDRVIVHPDYTPLPQPLIDRALATADASALTEVLAASADIALVRLAEPVIDVMPAVLHRGRDELGKIVKIVGKGATGTGIDGQGPDAPHRTTLRRAFNTIGSVDARWLGYVFEREPAGHLLEGAMGDGDSGGPVLIDVDGQWQLAGLAAWKLVEGDLGAFRTGRYGQTSYNVRLSSYIEWIDASTAPERPEDVDARE